MTWDPQPQAETGAEPAAEMLPGDSTSGEVVLAEPQAQDRRPVVLIATGQLQVRALGSTVLQAAGFEVMTASRGETILADLPARTPDLILADLKLEDMDAAGLCSRIRDAAVGSSIPILVISDFLHSPTIREILANDFTDLVSVPVNWKVLTFRINRWISMARKFRSLGDQELDDFEQVRDSARKASTELLQLRNYDSVTGLPNREMFLSTVGFVVAQNERSSGYAAVLFVDIDDFKGVNDLIGRSLGDELLRIVAKRLQGCLREGDIVSQAGSEVASFARLSGDQYAILLSSVQDQTAAAAVAERLLASLSRPLTISDRQFRLSAKVGIADASQLDESGEEAVLQRAETAMRYCKQRKGKSWAFFESFMNELVLKKLELKAELQQALEQDQLFFCYQLLVDSRTGTPQGVEALVRWQHPLRGLISPNEFLPVAEESDLILEIDRWVLRNGCLQGKTWLDNGFPPLLISLNVSMRFLEEQDFAQQVLGIVEETGLPPASLQVELSERGTLPDAGRIMPQFEMLVQKGVHLALDDFGTGQTSLSYLRTLPITCVKVDRSFVRRVPDDSPSVAIVTAISAMSHHLGLKVVAEGVETEDHWRFLAENGYDQLQGFLFSKPERAEKIEKRFLGLGDLQPPVVEVPSPSDRPEPPILLPAPAEVAEVPPRKSPSAMPEAIPAAVADLTFEPIPIDDGEEATDRGDEPPQEESRRESPEDAQRGTAGRETADGWSQSEDYLLELARSDFLTKLYNRYSFDERLEHAVAHADRFKHKVALLLIDLDDFKYINDTHGHTVGDELLIAIGDRLRGLVRKVDTLARIGGDEFAVILSECHDLTQVADFASRMLSTLAQPVDVEGRELRVTGSLGIAVYPAAGTKVKDLLRQADLALYKVKNTGGNNVGFFAQEMDREVQRDLALARDLGGALERGELFIEYQMQIELETGAIVGAEALVRWNHPTKGVIAPGRFIPIAENTGEIRRIGRWVVQSACEQAARWRTDSGRDVRVSVNLSPVQCRDSRFVATILRTLREHGLAPELLDLEVNERLLKHLPKGLENSLRLLGELGVGLTLDNFGSGSSALEYFHRFRFDRLKIHQSLIRTISEAGAGASVLSGIVALARNMDVQIVAEGIEMPEELKRLRAEGCDQGQGFLFSRPLSADAISGVMSRSGTFPGFHGLAGEPPPDDPEPALEAAGDELSDIPDFEVVADEDLLGEQVLRMEFAEPESEEGESPPAEDGWSSGHGDEESFVPPERAAAAVAERPVPTASSEVRRLSSFAQSKRGRWKRGLGAVLVLAALIAGGAYLFRNGIPELPRLGLEPAATEPAATEPAATEPAATEPAATESAATEPAATEPTTAELTTAEPAAAEPAAPAPATTAVQSPAKESDDHLSRQILDLAEGWARAWSEQRVDDYLRFYAKDFRPPDGMSREDWAALRRVRILKPRRIGILLSAFEVEPVSPERARLSFDQSYQSDGYSDLVRKTLKLVREDGGWKILEEKADG